MVKKKSAQQFVVCVSNKDYSSSLERRKRYLSLPDPEAENLGMLRVVDESGEDYLFPASLFVAAAMTRDELDRRLARADEQLRLLRRATLDLKRLGAEVLKRRSMSDDTADRPERSGGGPPEGVRSSGRGGD